MTKKDLKELARQIAASNFVSMAIIDLYRGENGESLAQAALRADRSSFIDRKDSAFKRLEKEVDKYASPLAYLYERTIGEWAFLDDDSIDGGDI